MQRNLNKWAYLNLLSWILVVAVFVFGLFSYSKIQQDLDNARLAAARLDSQVGAVGAAARENAQFLETGMVFMDSLSTICETAGRSQDPGLQTICANPAVFRRTERFGPTLIAETRAATARGKGDFGEAIKGYGATLDELAKIEDLYSSSPDEYRLRRMVSLEGQAYGHYRLGDLDAARQEIEAAIGIGDGNQIATSGFVYSTHLKILCAMDKSNIDPTKMFANYSKDLEGALARDRSDTDLSELFRRFWTEFRTDDLDYFTSDEELKIECNLS